ncbi:MAG TPA: hypothetical protein DEF00_00215 [Candidatus Taylorbacteria bacterium]|nr:MAG: hypothetical protein UY03_C0013G0006 [Parcubacteria group bacterium GW2011_GWA2_47_64]KKU96001.1 MAG: hypothetical protein UY29_C0017G0005 [Parcubacteria group bacterium GW2011_GWC2_48_17]HBV00805.1 hypothetical protein [Candidatus Taylorbacteria bacterium]
MKFEIPSASPEKKEEVRETHNYECPLTNGADVRLAYATGDRGKINEITKLEIHDKAGNKKEIEKFLKDLDVPYTGGGESTSPEGYSVWYTVAPETLKKPGVLEKIKTLLHARFEPADEKGDENSWGTEYFTGLNG